MARGLGGKMARDDQSPNRTTEQELRESEERYRALAELSPDATLVIAERRFAYANIAAARLLGAENAGQLTQLQPLEVLEPEFQEVVWQRIRDVLEEGKSTSLIEYRLKRLDGTPVDVEAAASPINWDGKRAVQVVARDITERKQAERELRENDIRLRAQHERIVEILESISDAFYAVDTGYRFTYVNRKAEELWGRDRRTLIGKRIWDEFPRAVGSESYRMHLLAMDRRRPVQFETVSPVINQWVDVSIYPESGGGLSCYFRDATERKRSEAALRESEARYRTLFESIDEGFCVIEVLFDDEDRAVDYRFLEVNPAFEGQTGLLDAVGKRMRELAPDLEEHWFEIYSRVARSGESVRFTQEAAALRGGVWYDVNAFRLGGEGSNKVAVLFKDVTEKKRTEEEVRELNIRLESLVAQRTLQLTQANQELESFNYSVSHDLRAPLRGMDGFAQVLLEEYGDKLDATGRSYLERVRSSAQRMGALIDDLLRLSRLSRSNLERSDVDLSRLISLVAADIRGREPGREVHFEIRPGLRAWADAGLLRVALENLLENAWKFTGDTPDARIEVGCEPHSSGPAFFVRDNGAGFDQRYADKLFVPFGRLHGADRFAGTGIGLAMVQRVIHLHGGRVWGEGEVGEGATFYFTLPYDQQQNG